MKENIFLSLLFSLMMVQEKKLFSSSNIKLRMLEIFKVIKMRLMLG